MVLFIHSARIDAMSSLLGRESCFSPMAKTAGNMVVDQSARLHKGVTDSRTDKLETAFFNALASASDAGAEVGGSSSVLAARAICGWPSTNDQTNRRKTPPFCSIASRAGVTDNGLNFTAMSYDARVLQQAFNLLLHSCDAYRVKLMKTGAVVLLLSTVIRDKPACWTFKTDHFKQLAIGFRYAPLVIMIGNIKGPG